MEVSDETCICLRNEHLSDNNSYPHLNLAVFPLTVKPPGSNSLLGVPGWAILKLIENTCVSITRFWEISFFFLSLHSLFYAQIQGCGKIRGSPSPSCFWDYKEVWEDFPGYGVGQVRCGGEGQGGALRGACGGVLGVILYLKAVLLLRLRYWLEHGV